MEKQPEEEEEEGQLDETGLEPGDIELVMQQADVSRAKVRVISSIYSETDKLLLFAGGKGVAESKWRYCQCYYGTYGLISPYLIFSNKKESGYCSVRVWLL